MGPYYSYTALGPIILSFVSYTKSPIVYFMGKLERNFLYLYIFNESYNGS